MKQRTALILTAAVALAVSGAAQEEKSLIRDERQKLEGRWGAIALVTDGKEVSAEHLKGARLVFRGNGFQLKGGEEQFRGTYEVDPTGRPKTITATFVQTDGTQKGKALGIYDLQADTLKIAWRHKGERPEKFESEPDSGVRFMAFRRDR